MYHQFCGLRVVGEKGKDERKPNQRPRRPVRKILHLRMHMCDETRKKPRKPVQRTHRRGVLMGSRFPFSSFSLLLLCCCALGWDLALVSCGRPPPPGKGEAARGLHTGKGSWAPLLLLLSSSFLFWGRGSFGVRVHRRLSVAALHSTLSEPAPHPSSDTGSPVAPPHVRVRAFAL